MTCDKNVGGADRIFRVVIGVALVGWGIATQNWWGAIGIIPLATATFGFCPAYAPFRFSSSIGSSPACCRRPGASSARWHPACRPRSSANRCQRSRPLSAKDAAALRYSSVA